MVSAVTLFGRTGLDHAPEADAVALARRPLAAEDGDRRPAAVLEPGRRRARGGKRAEKGREDARFRGVLVGEQADDLAARERARERDQRSALRDAARISVQPAAPTAADPGVLARLPDWVSARGPALLHAELRLPRQRVAAIDAAPGARHPLVAAASLPHTRR